VLAKKKDVCTRSSIIIVKVDEVKNSWECRWTYYIYI